MTINRNKGDYVLFYGACLPKTFVGTIGQAEDDIAFDTGHMCSDTIE